MDELVSVINRLQDVFASMGEDQVTINLPQIVVVGSQSAGKSSVLESIVGKEFLPRGDGLCTRRPLILQMYHHNSTSNDQDENLHSSDIMNGSINSSQSSPTEWAEFLHKPGVKYDDFEQVRDEILNETTRIGGSNAGISPIPIRLKFFSPHVLTLTLIDLPGITRNPIGDQPADIELQVRNLCEKYCKNNRTVILAVTAANTDLANSDGLSVAKKMDPAGERTIGVITKLDLMDEGTDASAILSNKLIPLKYGYIGVVNRSQKDINTSATVISSRKKERMFFKLHESYDEKKMGTEYLTSQLSKLLYRHIKRSLPSLRTELNTKLLAVESDLKRLGASPLTDFAMTDPFETQGIQNDHEEIRMSEVMLNIITKYAKVFSNAIDGKIDFDAEEDLELSHSRTRSSGGAKILALFHGTFHQELHAISPLHNLSDSELRRTILSTMGTKKALFVPENSFDLLVTRQIGYFQLPSVQCANRVFRELQRLAQQVQARSLQRFPTLQMKIVEVVTKLLERQLKPTVKMIENIISIEKSYINTNHPDFVGGPNAIKRAYSNTNRRSVAVNTRDPTSEEERSSQGVVALTPVEEPTAQIKNDNIMSFLFKKKPNVEVENIEAESAKSDGFDEAPNGDEEYAVGEKVEPKLNFSYEHQALNDMDCEIIKELMKSYLEVTRKNIEDLVPKTVMYFLVNYVRDNVQNALVREIYNRRNEYAVYLKEDPEIAVQRSKLSTMKKYLLKALDVLAQVDEFRFSAKNK